MRANRLIFGVSQNNTKIFARGIKFPSLRECTLIPQQTACCDTDAFIKRLHKQHFAYAWHLKLYKKLTYLPHKAVAEVSKDKEPIGRKCAEFNWFEIQLMSDSNELRVK